MAGVHVCQEMVGIGEVSIAETLIFKIRNRSCEVSLL
jgi:hypothetical protein